MSKQPDGSYLNIEDMPREQLETEYRRTNYFLARILKATGVRCEKAEFGMLFRISQDPSPGDYRIYYALSDDGEITTLEVRPHQ